MTTKLPIDLPIKSMTTKVSVGAQERVKLIATSHGFKLQDVISACLLHMPENDIVRIVEAQQKAVGRLPKAVKGLLRNVDKMTDEEREMLKDILS